MPFVLISGGGVFLTLAILGTGFCLIQHHSMMVKHGMTRYNNDLVRRKDKVKARKAEDKPLNEYKIISPFTTLQHHFVIFRMNTSSSNNSVDTPVIKVVPIKLLSVSAFNDKNHNEKQVICFGKVEWIII